MERAALHPTRVDDGIKLGPGSRPLGNIFTEPDQFR
jgi:hypothetical protein